MEIAFEQQERIEAPVERVWEEVDSLDEILAKTPQVSAHQLRPEGRSADLEVQLRWGPLSRTIQPVATLVDVRPQKGLVLIVDAPSMDLRFKGTLGLDRGGETATVLTYRTRLESEHWMSRRMRAVLSDMLEGHVHSLVDTVKARAERHHQAEEHLLA